MLHTCKPKNGDLPNKKNHFRHVDRPCRRRWSENELSGRHLDHQTSSICNHLKSMPKDANQHFQARFNFKVNLRGVAMYVGLMCRQTKIKKSLAKICLEHEKPERFPNNRLTDWTFTTTIYQSSSAGRPLPAHVRNDRRGGHCSNA